MCEIILLVVEVSKKMGCNVGESDEGPPGASQCQVGGSISFSYDSNLVTSFSVERIER